MNKRVEAVRMIKEGRLIKEVAEELNLSSRQIYNWLKIQSKLSARMGEDDSYLDVNYTLALAS